MTTSPIRIGIAGFGSAGRAFVQALARRTDFLLVGVADPSQALQTEVGDNMRVPVYPDLETMLELGELDAVYIATPTEMHVKHVELALAAKRHVIVEKPMAVNVNSAMAMVEAAEKSGVAFVVGHSHGFDMPVQAIRAVIEQGDLGDVRMVHSICYSDWMYRPRRPEELKTELGGGVTYRQGAHQFDMVRLICGGKASRIKAQTFDWNDKRPGVGAHTAFIKFENGAVANVAYNGYGNFLTNELCFDISEQGFDASHSASARTRTVATGSAADIEREKQKRARGLLQTDQHGPFQPFFGLNLVSCENGDIRQSPKGLFVYQDGVRREVAIPLDRSPRELVLDEFADAIERGIQPIHDARWGLANLELCDAAIRSSKTDKTIDLKHQVALPRPVQNPLLQGDLQK
jgi:phthalate 4,5-cis-dihydrodiol dehydrogenase